MTAAFQRVRVELPPWLFARQPDTVYGSPDTCISRGVDNAGEVTAAYAETIVRAVRGKSSAKGIQAALKAVARRAPTRDLAAPVHRELLQGCMLGALDSAWEAEEDAAVALEPFAARRARGLARGVCPHHLPRLFIRVDPGFAAKDLSDATKSFLAKEPVTRAEFDSMKAAAQRRSVTVANAATKEMVAVVQRELARQVARGADLEEFGKHAAARLESAGWMPQNPSHLETVFRTNVLNAYGGGRNRQMNDPVVLAMRPFREWLGVTDGRQRPNHRKMHGVVLTADDPFWLEACPPAGYNCRCRCRSLSIAQGEPRKRKGSDFVGIVPDPGFTSGTGSLL